MKKQYYYLEPYVHLSIKKDDVLIYNPLNGEVLQYCKQPEINRFVKRCMSKKNLYVIQLLQRDLENPVVQDFIRKTRQLFMGDLLEGNGADAKPVQVVPGIKILQEISVSPNDEVSLVGMDLMSCLNELSFYLNKTGKSQTGEGDIFQKAYKQFLAPWSDGNKKEELSLQNIKKTIGEAENSSLFRINILGEDIFAYSQFKELVGLLNKVDVIQSYHTHYKHLQNRVEILKNIGETFTVKEDGNYKWELNVFVAFPVDEKVFSVARKVAAASGLCAKFHLVVRGEQEFELAEGLIQKYQLPDYTFHPFFDGRNLKFFKEQVFLDSQEITAARPSQRDLLTRKVLNQVQFGKFTVLSDGSVYANINLPALGNIGTDSLNQLVCKELHKGKGWMRNRSVLKPCNGCTYQYLCPSPSNYEYVIGKNDLCLPPF